ncbi:hypothetical protein BGW42_004950 [Actinomortierella wolfii]|nr:hypothetical protein BGW42_004950 [Actinomortierella wolfii]
MASTVKSLVQFYNRHYQKRPILTISITNALLAGVSDTLTQKYFSPSQPIKATATTAVASTAASHSPQDTLHEAEHVIEDKAKQAKQQVQWTKDNVVSSYGESLTGGLPTNGANDAKQSLKEGKETVKTAADHAKTFAQQTSKEVRERGVEGAKDMAEGYGQAAKEMGRMGVDKAKESLKGGQDNAKTAADHAKTFAQQTSKEVQERGLEGAKDMVEGYGQAAKEMGRIGAQKVQDKVQQLKEKVPPLVQSTASGATGENSKSPEAFGSTGMAKAQEKTNQSLEAFAFDYPRLGRFMFYNLAIAPVIHSWYTYIDRTFPLGTTAVSGGGGAAAQAMKAAQKATQSPSLSQSQVPSHKGATPLPTTRNPTGMSPGQEMAKSVVNKVSSAAAASGSIAGTISQSTWLRSTLQPAMRRMLVDQVFFAPVGLAMLFTGLTVLEGGGVKEVKEKLSESYTTALKTNYTIWPIVQLVNFR